VAGNQALEIHGAAILSGGPSPRHHTPDRVRSGSESAEQT